MVYKNIQTNILLLLFCFQVHFDAYNKKFGSDGFHDPLDWTSSQVQEID